jgi:hypothetical protein
MTSLRSRSDHIVMVASALVLASVFTVALLLYYRAFHFGVGAAFAGLTLGFPTALALSLGAGYLARAWVVRTASRADHPLRSTLIAMVVALAVLFAAEWLRTSDDRVRDRLASTAHRLTLVEADGRFMEARCARNLFDSPAA